MPRSWNLYIFYMQLQKKERSPQQKIQYGRRSVPRLHSWTRFGRHEWKSFVLHHKYRGRRRYACVNRQETCYQRKSDLNSIALAGPGLFVFYMYAVFLCSMSKVNIDIISMILITKENPISDLVDYIWITEGLTVNTTIPFITCCVLSHVFSSCTQNDRRCSENVKYF